MSTVTAFLILCQAATTSGNTQEAQLLATWKAVCQVESGNNPKAYRKSERAAGIAQIRPIMVKDCNRIKGGPVFTLEDRWSPVKSYEMFRTHSLHYWPQGGPEQWARGWNGGAKGMEKVSTTVYWQKVQRQMVGE